MRIAKKNDENVLKEVVNRLKKSRQEKPLKESEQPESCTQESREQRSYSAKILCTNYD